VLVTKKEAPGLDRARKRLF